MTEIDSSGSTDPVRAGGHREEGVVLLLILGLIVLTTVAVYVFARLSVLEAISARQRQARVRAELLAEAGVEIGIRAVLDDLYMSENVLNNSMEGPDDPQCLLSRTPIELPEQAGTLRITIQDSGSRISLNGLVDQLGEPLADSKPFLMAALERIIDDLPGRQEEKTYEIEDLADAILDWLDINDQTRLGDDEADYYEGQGSGGPPINRPAFILDELSTIPEMDDSLLEAFKAYFETQPMFDVEHSGVNPNTAPPHVLGMIYHGTAQEKRLLDNDDVFPILEARQTGTVFCKPGAGYDGCSDFEELMEFAGESFFPPLQYESNIFTIRSVAKLAKRFGEARACVTTVITREDPEEPGTLLYRKECDV